MQEFRSASEFCTCPVTKCSKHPSNHRMGCDPCIDDNLKKGKMPACFFLAVSKNMAGVKNFSMESFVQFFEDRRDEYLKNKESKIKD